ncbi:hypothetical protein RZN22_18925 [Bacillaceae bacterium S4-13-58]
MSFKEKMRMTGIRDQGPRWNFDEEWSSSHFWEVIIDEGYTKYAVVTVQKFKGKEKDEWEIEEVYQISEEFGEEFPSSIDSGYEQPIEQLKNFIKIKCGGYAQRVSKSELLKMVPETIIKIANEVLGDNEYEIESWNHNEAIIFNRHYFKIVIWGRFKDRIAWTCYEDKFGYDWENKIKDGILYLK